MWLFSSSIGRKFVMAVTGACLILFVTFHVLMNSVALIWPTAYNQVCEFLGANWYALIASAGLAALFIIHILYACWLTIQNRKARGADRYDVTSRPPQVEWSSKNMLVLGVVILAFLIVHLAQFWYKMQWQEMLSHNPANWFHANFGEGDAANSLPVPPAFGTMFLDMAFGQWWTVVVYLIGFAALWLHMNHGFWSMFHSVGWDGSTWINRLKKIGCWWTTIVIALFVAQAALFTYQAKTGFFRTDPALQQQYAEYWNEKATELSTDFQMSISEDIFGAQPTNLEEQIAALAKMKEFLDTKGQEFVEEANIISECFSAQCPSIGGTEGIMRINQLKTAVERQSEQIDQQYTMLTSVQNQQPESAKEAPEVDNTQIEIVE